MTVLDTKTRILEAAEPLMLEHSFHSVGLNQILQAVNVPKGSFYHHFASKEEFGIELLKHYIENATACKRLAMLDREAKAKPLEHFFAGLEAAVEKFEAGGAKCPCLIAKLAAEVSSLSDAMREVLSDGFSEWVGLYQEVLEHAKASGELPADLDARVHACLVHDLWFGATLRAVAERSGEPLRSAIDSFRRTLGSTTAS